MPKVHEAEWYWHLLPTKSQERQNKYGDRVDLQLDYELGVLKSATERDLDFDYKLRLSRSLRKLRRRLKYGR